MKPRSVLIVGCGIAGQVLACALAKRGIGCELVELKPAFDIIGAGMYVQSNALRALLDIGVADEIVSRGWHAADDISHIADRNGDLLTAFKIPRIAGPAYPGVNPIQRHTLHEILHAAVKRAGVPLRMGCTVESIDQSDDAAQVRFSDGSSKAYDLVVGADGIRSTVRRLCFAGYEPQFTGYSIWRVLMPRPEWNVRPIWFMGLGRTFGVVPLSTAQCYLAGVTKEPGNPRHARTELRNLLRERFGSFGGPIPELLAAVTPADEVVYTPAEEILMPLPWIGRRVLVVGDAAHASTPFWAQGASMAIEDVVVLAELLALGNPIEATLAAWQARRHPRCLFVQQGSLSTGQRSHDESPGALDRLYAHLRANGARDAEARYARLAEPI